MIQKKYYEKLFLHIKGYIQFQRFFSERDTGDTVRPTTIRRYTNVYIIIIIIIIILTFTFAICYRPSVCRLSVTLVHPTQAVEIFRNFFSPYDSSRTLVF